MKTFVLSLFLFLPVLIWGQAQHELKLGILSSLDKQPRLIYEYNNGSNLGFEFHVGYFDRFLYINKADTVGIINDFEAFTQNFLALGASMKFYIEPNAKGAGAFLGVHLRNEIKVSEEKGFDETFLEVYGEAPPSEADDLFSIGAIVGYKWLIAGHWIIEPQFAYSRNLIRSVNTKEYIATITLSLGYRF
jgi:hypothetical protein